MTYRLILTYRPLRWTIVRLDTLQPVYSSSDRERAMAELRRRETR